MSELSRECVSEVRVRYSETDQMGVVYHANYLVWCEIGRTDYLRTRGPSYSELEASGLVLAVSDASLRYHRSARYDDLIRIRTAVEELRSRSIRFGYRIARVERDGSETRLASAATSLIALDRDGRPRTLPAELLTTLRGAAAPEST